MAEEPIAIVGNVPRPAGSGLGQVTGVKIRDGEGKDWNLHHLTLRDYVDLEGLLLDEFGITMQDYAQGTRTFAALSAMLWFGIRRDGQSPDQVKKKEWALSREEMMDRFGAGQIQDIAVKVQQMLAASGFAEVPVVGEPKATLPEGGGGVASESK